MLIGMEEFGKIESFIFGYLLSSVD